MKIISFWIDDEDTVDRALHINFVAETQKEAKELFEACNAMPKSVEAYGSIGDANTWAWLKIPLKKRTQFSKKYFGNTEF